MRSIKNKNEIELMKKAGEVVAIALEKIEEEVRPGITTLDLDTMVEEVIRKSGAIPSFKGYKAPVKGVPDYPGSICVSINNEVVHGIPSLRVLKDGDIISVDVGAYIYGFHGDAARTFPVGEISQKASQLIQVTKQSFYEGIKFAVTGNRINDISSGIEEYVKQHGYSVVREFVGHGIGKEMHEYPSIPNYRSKVRGPRLEPGMTLAIEPMVNEGGFQVRLQDNGWTVVTADGTLSAHYENTIAITDGDPMILTKRS